MYRPVQTDKPGTLPVSLALAKEHLRVEDDDEKALIEALIGTATAHLDGWTGTLGRCIVSQKWRQDFDDFDDFWPCLRIPLVPVLSVESVKYRDAAGAEQTVAADNYRVLTDARGPHVRFATGFSVPSVYGEGPSVSVTYVAGYEEVPAPITQAILLMVGHWFEHREAVIVGPSSAELPIAVDALLLPFKRPIF